MMAVVPHLPWVANSMTSRTIKSVKTMKKNLLLIIALLCAIGQGAWAADYNVSTDSELRAAIQNNGANITVTADIDLSNSTLSIESGKTVTINLNGHTLDRKLTQRGSGGGQVITVRKGGTLYLSGGTLKGGWGGDSGGINNEGGTANLTNVTITGCTGDDRGGGICNRAGGTLNMTGGAITNNISNDHTGPKGGGGLFNYEGATATLTGVTITGNVAKVYGGGGICNFGTLTIDGCIITGNTAHTDGGGVWNGSPENALTVNGGTITGNTAGGNGGGIYSNHQLQMGGLNTKVKNNTGNGGAASNVYLTPNDDNASLIKVTGILFGSEIGVTLSYAVGHITIEYNKDGQNPWSPNTIFFADDNVFYRVTVTSNNQAQIEDNNPIYPVTTETQLRRALGINNANIKLGADIDLSNSTLEIQTGKTITLDLNGHTLDRKLTKRGEGGGQVITVRSGGTLNLSNGTLKGGWGGAGGALVNEGGTVTITDVIITHNVADDRGGGVCNRTGGTLTMTDCSITDNHSNDKSGAKGGGGLFNEEGATATLTNVTITGNEAKVCGGGGICNFGTLTIDGCTITGNTAGTQGGAIWQEGTLNMQGANTITSNTGAGGKANNVYLKNGAVIGVTGSLTGSSVSVTMESKTGTLTSGYSTYNTIDPATLFSTDLPQTRTITLAGDEAQVSYVTEVTYIERSWNSQQKKVVATERTLPAGSYTVITSSTTSLNGGTYVVFGDVTINGKLASFNNTKIILTDDACLTVNGGFEHSQNQGAHLSIYPQAEGSGKLICNGTNDHQTALVPGGYGGHMDIHGGIIQATGGRFSSGIGTIYGQGGHYGTVSIYDGDITATGGEGSFWTEIGGPGIGVCYKGMNGTLKIYGGTIHAYGGYYSAGIGSNSGSYAEIVAYVHIYGGKVYAYGHGGAAGLGSGPNRKGVEVNISGGYVYAEGGDDDAPGIGSGKDSDGYKFIWNKVNISGGTVIARGHGDAAGIGGGYYADGAEVTITGGHVEAWSGEDTDNGRAFGSKTFDANSVAFSDSMCVIAGETVNTARIFSASEREAACKYRNYARIEACSHPNATYTVSGTTDNDTHTRQCAYCLDHTTELHNFYNGTCTVCGIEATTYAVRIYLPKDQGSGTYDGETYSSQTTQMVPGSTFTMPPSPTTVPGLEFKGWEVSNVTSNTYTSVYTTTNGGTILQAGHEYTINNSVSFIARYQMLDITLKDDEDNSETLMKYGDMTANSITLTGRTLSKNNKWNTLCLPFNLSEEQLAASPLAGCMLKELDVDGTYGTKQTGFDNGTLNLYFKTVTSIEAGKAYIIKWSSGSGTIENPTFSNVTIADVQPDVTSADDKVSFKGIYSPKAITGEDKTMLYLGADNKLYYPNDAMVIYAFRGYFHLNGITAGDVTSARMFFGDENDATGIKTMSDVRSQMDDAWYTLDGRKLQGKPTQKGVYINNGKKVVIQ